MSAPTAYTRPVQPSIRREVGEYLMAADPRCAHPAVLIAAGAECPRCHLSRADYVAAAPLAWPA